MELDPKSIIEEKPKHRIEITKRSMKVFEQRPFSEVQSVLVNEIKNVAALYLDTLDLISIPPDNAAEVGRLISLARTSAEESVMWATKAVSRFNKG